MKPRYCFYLLLVFSLFMSVSVRAQMKPFSLGAYAEVAWPTDKFQESYSNGYGGGVDVNFKLPVKLTLTGSAGFLHFEGKTIAPTVKTQPINVIPVRVGVKYRFSILYAKFETGAASILDGGGTSVVVSPGIGIKLSSLDLQGKYEAWLKDGSSNAFYGLKLGIHF